MPTVTQCLKTLKYWAKNNVQQSCHPCSSSMAVLLEASRVCCSLVTSTEEDLKFLENQITHSIYTTVTLISVSQQIFLYGRCLPLILLCVNDNEGAI